MTDDEIAAQRFAKAAETFQIACAGMAEAGFSVDEIASAMIAVWSQLNIMSDEAAKQRTLQTLDALAESVSRFDVKSVKRIDETFN